MNLLVKICGLRTETDVSVAIDAGADAVGFVFAESPRQVTPADAARAAAQCTDGVIKVAVMRHPSNDDWEQVLRGFQPDVLQTDLEDFDVLDVPDTVKRWPVIREGVSTAHNDVSDTFLYEGKNSGSGERVDWRRAADVAEHGKMILAGGLDAHNVATAVRIVRPFGVDVSSAVESEPGIKDPELIRRFVRAARAAESIL